MTLKPCLGQVILTP